MITGHLIEKSEYPAILEEAFHKYYLDGTKMFRYARRRNVEARMKTFIRQETLKLLNRISMIF